MILDSLETGKLVRLVLDQLERPGAHHLQVLELGRFLDMRFPDVLGQHVEVDQLAFHVGDRLGQGDHHGFGVGRLDRIKEAGVRVEERKIRMRPYIGCS